MNKIFIYLALLAATISFTSCSGVWDEHYADKVPDADWGSKPQALPTLFNTIMQNQEQYSYVLSFFDIDLSQEEIIIKESSLLNSYFNKYSQYTMVLFTDAQFDAAVKAVSLEFEAAVLANSSLKTELLKNALLRSCLVGKNASLNSDVKYKTFDGKQVTISEATAVSEVESGNVFAYSNELENLPLDIFSFVIEPETWPTYAMGGGSSRTTVLVPQVENGNGSASWFNGNNAHLFMRIGGTVNGKTYYWLNGFTYKIKVGVGLYKSTKMALWTHAAAGADQKMVMAQSPLFDASGDFVNATYDGGMTELEFELPLYPRDLGGTAVKFHIDFRGRTAPLVNGEVPTTAQKGFVVDYIVYEPIFN